MRILAVTVNLYIPWVQSLKGKRMEVKSLVAKLKKHFNLSVMETDNQDMHKTITLTLAAVTLSEAEGERLYNNLLDFIYNNSQGEVRVTEKELL